MKRFFAALLILMLPAFASADNMLLRVDQIKYDLNASVTYGLPKLPEPIEKTDTLEIYYCEPTKILITFKLEDSKHIGLCQTNAETKMDDFLLTSACILDVMNKVNNKTEAHGFLLDLYASCRIGKDGEFYLHEYNNGFLISFMKEAGIYIFVCGDI